MERVLGLGGVFFKAKDPQALSRWYAEHLGVPMAEGKTYATFTAAAGDQTELSVMSEQTSYFAPSTSSFMLNFRVSDLSAMLAQLRAAGVQVEERTEEHEYGIFGWCMDPEGNRVELWQPIGTL